MEEEEEDDEAEAGLLILGDDGEIEACLLFLSSFACTPEAATAPVLSGLLSSFNWSTCSCKAALSPEADASWSALCAEGFF